MRGQQQSGTRRLNRHWQSGQAYPPTPPNPYVYIADFYLRNIRFTEEPDQKCILTSSYYITGYTDPDTDEKIITSQSMRPTRCFKGGFTFDVDWNNFYTFFRDEDLHPLDVIQVICPIDAPLFYQYQSNTVTVGSWATVGANNVWVGINTNKLNSNMRLLNMSQFLRYPVQAQDSYLDDLYYVSPYSAGFYAIDYEIGGLGCNLISVYNQNQFAPMVLDEIIGDPTQTDTSLIVGNPPSVTWTTPNLNMNIAREGDGKISVGGTARLIVKRLRSLM